jgi:hypothetical protein
MFEFQCSKTGERWYKDEQEFICPIKRKCKEDIKVVGYLIMEIIVNTTGLKLETYEKVSKR